MPAHMRGAACPCPVTAAAGACGCLPGCGRMWPSWRGANARLACLSMPCCIVRSCDMRLRAHLRVPARALNGLLLSALCDSLVCQMWCSPYVPGPGASTGKSGHPHDLRSPGDPCARWVTITIFAPFRTVSRMVSRVSLDNRLLGDDESAIAAAAARCSRSPCPCSTCSRATARRARAAVVRLALLARLARLARRASLARLASLTPLTPLPVAPAAQSLLDCTCLVMPRIV